MNGTLDTSEPIEPIFAGNLTCVPDGNNYQWGASWELHLLILIVQIAWSMSLFFIWLEVTVHSPLVRQSRKMTMWRAIVDLIKPLLQQLGPDGGMLDLDQLEEYVRHISSVHYEAKIDGVQDGGYCQDVHLVSSSDTIPADTEVTGK